MQFLATGGHGQRLGMGIDGRILLATFGRPMGPVLLVHDDSDVLASWCDELLAASMRPTAAASAEEALDYLRTFPVAVVVAGHCRPELDALRLFTTARLYRPLIRGILCTASIDQEDALRAAQLGFDDIVYLPYRRQDDLLRSVATSVGLAGTWHDRIRQFRDPKAPIYWQSVGFAPAMPRCVPVSA